MAQAATAVVVDVTRLISRLMDDRLPTGVDRVSLAYLQHYQQGARAMFRHGARSGLFSEGVSRRMFELLLEWPLHSRKRLRSLLWQGLASCIGRGNGRGRFMFNTGHSGLEGNAASRQVRWHNVRPLFMVHDLIPVLHPEFCRPGEAERHEERLQNMLRLGAGIIANSDATLEDLKHYAGNCGLPLPPAVVAPLAPAFMNPDVQEFLRPAAMLGKPYFVMLGTIEPRKNHLMVLQAWQRLIARHGDDAPRLVIIGQQGWESENVDDMLDRSRVLKGHVDVYRDCSDEELKGWLQHARALLFPSFSEGYGMPVVEALAVGLPVIASDLPVLRQVGDGVPDFLDPLDTLSWIRMVDDYTLDNSPRRAAQLQRMQTYVVPTWSDHFALVDDFLRRLNGSH